MGLTRGVLAEASGEVGFRTGGVWRTAVVERRRASTGCGASVVVVGSLLDF